MQHVFSQMERKRAPSWPSIQEALEAIKQGHLDRGEYDLYQRCVERYDGLAWDEVEIERAQRMPDRSFWAVGDGRAYAPVVVGANDLIVESGTPTWADSTYTKMACTTTVKFNDPAETEILRDHIRYEARHVTVDGVVVNGGNVTVSATSTGYDVDFLQPQDPDAQIVVVLMVSAVEYAPRLTKLIEHRLNYPGPYGFIIDDSADSTPFGRTIIVRRILPNGSTKDDNNARLVSAPTNTWEIPTVMTKLVNEGGWRIDYYPRSSSWSNASETLTFTVQYEDGEVCVGQWYSDRSLKVGLGIVSTDGKPPQGQNPFCMVRPAAGEDVEDLVVDPIFHLRTDGTTTPKNIRIYRVCSNGGRGFTRESPTFRGELLTNRIT